MLEPMILTEAQEMEVDKALTTDSGAWLLASEMGEGKTGCVVEYIKRSGVQTVLIIGPLQTMGESLKEGDEYEEGWWGTLDRQGVTLPFRVIDSTATGKAALADWSFKTPGIYFVGQELFARLGWEKQFYANGVPKMKWDKKKKKNVQEVDRSNVWQTNPDLIVFDEVHRGQNRKSLTSRTLRGGRLGYKKVDAKFKIGASGTFYGNTFDGAWAITKWLWPALIDDSYYVWAQAWTINEPDPRDPYGLIVEGEKVEGAFVASLPCYTRIESDLDIEVIDKDFWVDMTPAQQKVYDDLDTKMVAWLADHPLIVKFPMTKWMRQVQVGLGMPSIVGITADGRDEIDFALDCESPKIDILLSEVLPNFFEGEPAIISTNSRKFAVVLVHRINEVYGAGSAVEWSGKVPKKTRQENKNAFIRGEFPYIVGVISAMGTGSNNLQRVARNTAYISRDSSRIANEQNDRRTLRKGQVADSVRFARIMSKGTVDGGQLSMHVQKQLAANASMKQKPMRRSYYGK